MATLSSSSSTTHIRKRQYQPSITSYFANRDADPTLRKTTSPLSPPLPEETQASLLSVGMRVRKSVPEGYKTHKTIPPTGFPFPSTAPSAKTSSSQNIYGSGGLRELQPFCGLHKIGGWATQEIPPSSAPAALEGGIREDDDLPDMTMSQSTIQSTQASSGSLSSVPPASSRKRTYEDEIEDDLDAFFDDVEDVDAPAERDTSTMSRPKAPMKSRRQSIGKENMISIVGEADFEEATFLAPPDGMDIEGS